ncbi:MAG: prepilin peptidase [Planctomycetota bacterium]|nr:prepilin peptidase [Planctomycetota bacterium]
MTTLPSATWRMLSDASTRRRPLHQGLDAVWHDLRGRATRLVPRTRRFMREAEQVLAQEEAFRNLSDAALREAAEDLRALFRRGRDERADLIRGFALVREAAFRELGMRPFHVQIAGALALDAGCIVEMATGEGKTLTATLPATIAGWRGRGCHVITVNDYLATRDADWMRPLYARCGLTVASVAGDTPHEQRRAGYLADITYTTNKEVAADYLRDRLVLSGVEGARHGAAGVIASGASATVNQRLIMRGLEFAIVDEADSVLIDEAVTPLIISGQGGNPQLVEAIRQAAELAAELDEGLHYRIDHRHREVSLTRAGEDEVEARSEEWGGVWKGARRREELIVQALTARALYELDRQYVIQEDKVVIVDDFTGRLMPDRSWRDGFHQAVEAKEKLEINAPKDTMARVSFQRFFRMYRKLSGMTGTAREQTGEFWRTYHLPVAVIPTNKPVRRTLAPDRVFATRHDKWLAVAEEAKRIHASGRPILIGTRSVQASELLSKLLAERGLHHEVLNAVRHAEEARIIAAAGEKGRITVATNMAGRGTDIRLSPEVLKLGGLHVIATERHESRRIDRQLFGRAGRQGDPGSGQAFVSLEDEIIRRFAARPIRILKGAVIGSGHATLRPVFSLAQRRASRLASRMRREVLRSDDWLDEALGFTGRSH